MPVEAVDASTQNVATEKVADEVVEEVVDEKLKNKVVIPESSKKNEKTPAGDSALKQTGKIFGGIAYNVGVETLAQTGSVLAQQALNRFLNGGEDIVPVDPFRDIRMPFDGQSHDPISSQIASPFDQCKDPFSSVRNPFGMVEDSQESQFLDNLRKEVIKRNTYTPKTGIQQPKRKLAGLIFKGEKFKDLSTITTNTEDRKTFKRKHEEIAGQTGQPNQEPPKKPKKDDDKDSDKDDQGGKFKNISGEGNLANQSRDELLRSKRSYEKLIQEHKEKLEAYLKNPDKYDNKGFLKNAPNTNIRQQIINNRAEILKKDILKQEGELAKINFLLNK
ncbi:MAG: hypothetical protein ABIA74_02650 [bacterium]